MKPNLKLDEVEIQHQLFIMQLRFSYCIYSVCVTFLSFLRPVRCVDQHAGRQLSFTASDDATYQCPDPWPAFGPRRCQAPCSLPRWSDGHPVWTAGGCHWRRPRLSPRRPGRRGPLRPVLALWAQTPASPHGPRAGELSAHLQNRKQNFTNFHIEIS